MKQVFILSGIGALVMTLLVVTGMIQLNPDKQNVIHKGNEFYEIEEYEKAKEWYNKGMESNTKQPIIEYNLGLVEYRVKNYEQAATHFGKSENNFMILGNTFYRQGTSQQDVSGQMEMYQKSLEQYLAGIKDDPYDVELKYNYEFVKKLLEDIQEQQNQEQQDQEKENQDKENQDNQDQKDQNGENQNQEDDQEKQNQNEENQDNQDNQNEENQDSENQDEDNKEGQNEKSSEKEEQEEQKDQSKTGENGEQDNINPVSNEDREAIEQVLKMLEQQEEQSLKNNQAVMNQGKEEANDW